MDIIVTDPQPGQVISSPLTVSGQARGTWFFEASAPIKVLDSAGHVIGQSHIEATGEWMTDQLVFFTGSVSFTQATGTGSVVFMNDNPSGDPVRDKSFTVPITFQ